MRFLLKFFKDFLFKRNVFLSEDKKEFSEAQVFFYARKRVSEVFHLSLNEVQLEDVIGEGKLLVKPPSLLKSNELDILNEDMFCASWDYTQASVLAKMHLNKDTDTLKTVHDYCNYIVCCYQNCTKRSYKTIVDILSMRKK